MNERMSDDGDGLGNGSRIRESWRDSAARIVATLGHLIIWSAKPKNIGEVLHNLDTSECIEKTADQPFVVIGEATKEQFIRQMAVGNWPTDRLPDVYYYFVQTD
jgi:hypothetical protein